MAAIDPTAIARADLCARIFREQSSVGSDLSWFGEYWRTVEEPPTQADRYWRTVEEHAMLYAAERDPAESLRPLPSALVMPPPFLMTSVTAPGAWGRTPNPGGIFQITEADFPDSLRQAFRPWHAGFIYEDLGQQGPFDPRYGMRINLTVNNGAFKASLFTWPVQALDLTGYRLNWDGAISPTGGGSPVGVYGFLDFGAYPQGTAVVELYSVPQGYIFNQTGASVGWSP